jgi:hypothetical protein
METALTGCLVAILSPFILIGLWLIYALIGLIAAVPIYYLWNWLVPSVFHGPHITYWIAWGLFMLSHILLPGGGVNSSGNKK